MSWIREIFGWLLVFAGLGTFGLCLFVLLPNHFIFEAAPTTFIGFILLRTGLHLIKVAVASRIARQAALEYPVRQPRPSAQVVRSQNMSRR
jgi:hypothetical protein